MSSQANSRNRDRDELTTNGEPYKSLRRHRSYYLAGGDLFLLAGQDLFRIHRYFFERDSDYWAAKLMTGTTAAPGGEPIGTADSNAIVLPDIQSDDLATFLWVFYNPKYSLYNTTVDDWTIILSLAAFWSFREVKSLAVRELQRLQMPDIDRICLYQDKGVDRGLLIPCYSALAHRKEPITLEEGSRMGLETSIMLAKAREEARSGLNTPSGLADDEMQEVIVKIFGVEPSTLPEEPMARPLTNGNSSFPVGANGSHTNLANTLGNGHPTSNGTGSNGYYYAPISRQNTGASSSSNTGHDRVPSNSGSLANNNGYYSGQPPASYQQQQQQAVPSSGPPFDSPTGAYGGHEGSHGSPYANQEDERAGYMGEGRATTPTAGQWNNGKRKGAKK